MKLFQSAWLMMALFCVVFAGPVKKAIQLHTNPVATRDEAIKRDNQTIRTGYREKHEIQSLVDSRTKQVPGTPFAGSFIYESFTASSKPYLFQYGNLVFYESVNFSTELEKYLLYQNIRV